MKKLILLMAAIMAMSASAFAEGDKGDGCGLGWQITQKRTMIATTTRGTTNGFVPPTFGMTSGTIGCEQHPFAKEDMPAANYAATNFENLSVEMAQGNGETLQGFARTLGCDDSAMEAFGSMTQSNYSALSESRNAVELLSKTKAQIKADPVLSASCS